MKTKLYYIATDDDGGSQCHLYQTYEELQAALTEIILEDVGEHTKDDLELWKTELAANWSETVDRWFENEKCQFFTLMWGETEIDIKHPAEKFADMVSRMTHEGEPDGMDAFEMTSEDAIATVNRLIMEARVLLGTADKCGACGDVVHYIIGTPGGQEVCQECFDAGQG